MADMTVQEFLALVQEYDTLWSEYDEEVAPAAWHGIPWTTDPGVIAYFKRLQSVQKRIEACGFDVGIDKQRRVRLYLAGKSPKSARPRPPGEQSF